MRDEIERFKGQGVEMEEKRKAILRDLEVRAANCGVVMRGGVLTVVIMCWQVELGSVQEQTAEYDKRYRTATATLDQLKTG